MNDIRNPTLHTAGLAAAESVANAALRLSPHSVEALKGLADQVLALECTRPALTSEEDGTLRLRGVHDGPVATRVTGSLEDFAELARADDPAATLINGGIRLEGRSAPLIDMQRILGDLDIDWEAPLVASLGDVVGHQLATMLGGAFEWSRSAASSLQRQIGEFATEEAGLTPPRIALEHFYDDVQSLSERTERLTQRIERLRTRARALGDA